MKIESSGLTFTVQTDRQSFAFLELMTEPCTLAAILSRLGPDLHQSDAAWHKTKQCNVLNVILLHNNNTVTSDNFIRIGEFFP